jgi:3-hydroxy-D-aspartate aldolase
MTEKLELGFNVPAKVGQALNEICTPALIVDLDVFERNVATMKCYAEDNNIRLRAHAKTHKSADISAYLIKSGGCCGICCQKLSEAEGLIKAGVEDILLTNIVVDPIKIERLIALTKQARIIVCVDDIENAKDLAMAAERADTILECLVEIEVGHMVCGIPIGVKMIELAKFVDESPSLKFEGIQAYQGMAQHTYEFSDRQALLDIAIDETRKAVELLASEGLTCNTIGGGGTGTHPFETKSGIYNELQCGSYIFMDVDYLRVKMDDGSYLSDYKPSLFVYSTVVSNAKPGRAICDAGLKAQSVDSGLPEIFGMANVEYVKCIDEHGVLLDPEDKLKLNDRISLIPGHCDPTCNLHEWFVCVRNGVVESLWPITSRGKFF